MKGLRGTTWNRNFTSVFGDRTSFCAKGLRWTTWEWQLYLSFWHVRITRDPLKFQYYLNFWRSNLVSCERIAPDDLGNVILPQFLAIEPHFVRKGCAGQFEIAILPQFSAIESHFVRKGYVGHFEIVILLQFLAIEPHFLRKGCVSCRLVGIACPPPSEEK